MPHQYYRNQNVSESNLLAFLRLPLTFLLQSANEFFPNAQLSVFEEITGADNACANRMLTFLRVLFGRLITSFFFYSLLQLKMYKIVLNLLVLFLLDRIGAGWADGDDYMKREYSLVKPYHGKLHAHLYT